MCICPSCPSWAECGEKGGCCFETIGKSGGISEENGCICLGFPVANKLRLDYMYQLHQRFGKRTGKLKSPDSKSSNYLFSLTPTGWKFDPKKGARIRMPGSGSEGFGNYQFRIRVRGLRAASLLRRRPACIRPLVLRS
ncbi:DUF2769 domain-containing protein [Methanosarcina sp. Mfa9]|uniref:DUF2769 domain-containing protein n=1 Tax=Methanosarcina sp. Mfa9 TaxID=3439063 RepID=UPI003F83A183